ncbi:SGNH hydrolase-type esterase domain-containing protein [Dissophora ornata]|nr:SGNH hydrolase-type esterase domain-containing protein [Dissophora ornata]
MDSNTAADSRIVKVLCLGDSLTAGFVKGAYFAPYSDHLANLFKDQHPQNNIDVIFVNAGINGDTIDHIQERLPNLLRKDQYHHVVFLAGTNDLGGIDHDEALTAEEEVAHLSYQGIYDMMTAAPTLKSFLQLTIPYNAFDRLDPTLKDMKDALNDRILREPCPKKKVLDLNDPQYGFNNLLMTDDERSEYWQDGLHYTAKGYKRLADCICNGVAEMILE